MKSEEKPIEDEREVKLVNQQILELDIEEEDM